MQLEATPVNHLSPEQKLTFRLLIANAISYGLGADQAERGIHSIRTAEEFIRCRNNEYGRMWFLGGMVGVLGITLLCGILVLALGESKGEPNAVALLLKLYGNYLIFGALGAFMSIALRVSHLNMDPSAGYVPHTSEGAIRTLAGMVSGLIAVLACKGNLLFSLLTEQAANNLDPESPYALWLLAFVAGMSERLIPDLASQFTASPNQPQVRGLQDAVATQPAAAPASGSVPAASPTPAAVPAPATPPAPAQG